MGGSHLGIGDFRSELVVEPYGERRRRHHAPLFADPATWMYAGVGHKR
ncbi:hypothetical protein ACIHFD_29160 [Nonomuraea sp. NPDC051941]